ncbi:MAG: hypothetical protein Kow0037_15720 [Calditrichia bacterium]
MLRFIRATMIMAFCAMLGISHAQTIHQVAAGTDVLKPVIDAASPGDIIELTTSGGEYLSSDQIEINKSLTIRAADGLSQKPVLKYVGTSTGAYMFRITSSPKVVFKSIEFNGDGTGSGGAAKAKYALSLDNGDTLGTMIVKVDNCVLHDFNEKIIKPYGECGIDSLIVTNSILYNGAKEGITVYTGSSSDPKVYLKVGIFKNNTFYNFAREGIKGDTNPDPQILVDHCTFYNCGGSSKGMIFFDDMINVEVKNSVFVKNSYSSYFSRFESADNLFHHNAVWDVVNFKAENATVSDTIHADPLFADPANGDFTLAANSPVLGMADDGWAMGDLRWDPTYVPGTTYQVIAGDGTIAAAIAQANDGDIIELVTSGGVYTHSATASIYIDKKLTIRARPGLAQKPIIRNLSGESTVTILQIMPGGSLVLQGVELDGNNNSGIPNAKYLIRTADIAQVDSFHYSLIVEDCFLHNPTEIWFKAYDYTIADTIRFSNCIFDNAPKEGILLKDGVGPTVNYIEFENCSFFRAGREAIRTLGTDPMMVINHCTFDSISIGSGQNKRMVYPEGVNNVTITNSIFTNQGGSHSEAIKLYNSSSIDFVDIFNAGVVGVSGSPTVGDSLWAFDPLYNDPANMDYRLSVNSPARGRASDGSALGDLRWEVLPTQVHLNIITYGNGIVTLDPPGGYYAPGTVVTATAIPDPNWGFDHWVGNVFPPNANPVTITMNQDETLEAHFVNLVPQVTLTVDTLGLGHVVLDPPPVNGTYDQGAQVTLTAVPQTNWQFVEWLGDTTATANPITVTLDSSMHMTARFESIFPQVTLTININGMGSVMQDPMPILGTYDINTMVTLTAQPALGWEFSGWSGDLVSTSNPDSILMDSDKVVTANFTEISFTGGAMEIDSTWDLYDAVEFANNNSQVDTLILTDGGAVYTSTNPNDVVVRKPLVIMAKPGLTQKPIITNSDVEGLNLDVFRVFDDFTLIGVEVDGGHPRSHGMKYAVRLRHYEGADSVKNGTNITFKDCYFHDFYENNNPAGDGHVLRFDKDFVAGVVKIENCVFRNIGYEALRMSETEKYNTDRCLDSLIIRNCTFNNIDAECVRYYSDLDSATVDAPVIIEHITIDSSATRVFYLKNSGGAIVRDIIISNSRLSGHGRDDDLMDVQGNGSHLSYVSDVDTFNVKAVPVKATDGVVDQSTLWGIDPRYEDRLNFNYTLLPESHLYELGHDGEALGDLNWATNTPTHVRLNITVVDSGRVEADPLPIGRTYDPNTLVWLTAIPDSGYEFIEWQGDLTGSTNPDSIRMTGDKAVTAIFSFATGMGENENLPTRYSLSQNFPNPFNPTTTIKFAIKQRGLTTLKIYDTLGREVGTVVNKVMEPGYYQVVYYNPNLASGIYFYRLKSGNFESIKKMMLIK